jgi:hypothetical protein
MLSTYNTNEGTVVHVSCLDDGYVLKGATELTCLPSGQWSSNIPSCGCKFFLFYSISFFIHRDPAVTVKTALQTLFLYFNLCLSVKFDSQLFAFISYLLNVITNR